METLLLDPADADVRVAFGMAEAEIAQQGAQRLNAELWRAIDVTLAEAAAHPEVFIDHELLRGDMTEFAIRAAIADLAVRLSLSEVTVRMNGYRASVLRQRTPVLWAWFLDGAVSAANAIESATAASELPEALWEDFQCRIVDPARMLTPAKFRAFVRGLVERLTADSLVERNVQARLRRGVWSEVDRDGMSTLHAYLASDDVAKIIGGLDAIARGLVSHMDEERTIAQLEADALVDLLTGARGGKVGVTVALTVPMLSLLGHSTEPAILEGVGPIDLETARRLAADAPSFTRLLTDPFNGEILTMDPKKYRATVPMRRWLGVTQITCDFPGCNRKADACDLDHNTDWAEGGATTAANLVHRCRKHHSMKHQTRWRVVKPPGAKRATWISPTGYSREADPPPF